MVSRYEWFPDRPIMAGESRTRSTLTAKSIQERPLSCEELAFRLFRISRSIISKSHVLQSPNRLSGEHSLFDQLRIFVYRTMLFGELAIV